MHRRGFLGWLIGLVAGFALPRSAKVAAFEKNIQVTDTWILRDVSYFHTPSLSEDGWVINSATGNIKFSRKAPKDFIRRRALRSLPAVRSGFKRVWWSVYVSLDGREVNWEVKDKQEWRA